MNILTNFIPMVTGSGTTTKTGGLAGSTLGALTGQINNGTYSKAAATADTQGAVNNALKIMMQQYAPSILSQSRGAGSYNSSQTQNDMSQLEGNATAAAADITAKQIAQYQQNQNQLAGILSQNSGTQQTGALDFTKLLMPIAGAYLGNKALSAAGNATGLGNIDISKLLTGDTSSLPSWLGGAGIDTAGTVGQSAGALATGADAVGGLPGSAALTSPVAAMDAFQGANLVSGASSLVGADAGLAGLSSGIGADIGGTAAIDAAGAVGADATAAIGVDAAAGAAGFGIADLLPILAWIICTELKDQGKLRKDWWVTGLRYFNTHYNDDAKKAYTLWATPVVAHMKKKPNGKLNKLMEIIFVNRAEWIAANCGTISARKTWKGFLGFWTAELFTILVGIVTLNKGVFTHWFYKADGAYTNKKVAS